MQRYLPGPWAKAINPTQRHNATSHLCPFSSSSMMPYEEQASSPQSPYHKSKFRRFAFLLLSDGSVR
jgi:hypothetical protein